MISLLIGLIFLCLVAYLLWWVLNQIPMPPPIRVVATVLFVLIMVVALLNWMPFDLPRGRFG